MPSTVEFWFDYSSPFAYLASTQVERVASEAGAEVRWRPFLLGALFNEIGTPIVPLHAFSEPRRKNQGLDLLRWAAWWNVPFRFTSKFPLRTVLPLRVTILADTPSVLIHRLMRAAWADDEDVSDPEVVRRCLLECGLDGSLVERAREAKPALIEATAEAVARELPGAPCFVVGEQLYWGQDRLHFVKAALEDNPPGGV